jgi:2-iminobutanoate/2-iminopropanoate deaminase
MKVIVSTPNAPEAIGAYSQAVKANGFLFLSGQIPIDPKTNQIEFIDITGQTKQVLENIKAILESEGLTLKDIVKASIFLGDLADFKRVNEIYASYFTSDPPARSTIAVAGLPKGSKIEIEVIAALS